MILIATVGVGGYVLGSNQNKVAQNQTQPTPITQPSPIPVDETANWKTYTNTKYSFLFRYPTRLNIEEVAASEDSRKEFALILRSSESGPNVKFPTDVTKQDEFTDNLMTVTLDVFDNKQNLPLKSFIQSLYNTIGIDGKNTVFQNMEEQGFIPSKIPIPESLLFVGSFTENPTKTYYFSSNKKVYEISLFGGFETGKKYSEKAEKEFDQILSTFKFIEQAQITPTAATEGKFCGGIAANLPENQCPVGYKCQLDGKYPDAGGKCVKQ